MDARYVLSAEVSAAEAVVPGFGDADARVDPVCVYVDGAWCVYALHVLVQCETGERWESAHAHHGTAMWREFVAGRPEWADLAIEYRPEEAERLAHDAAEELSSDADSDAPSERAPPPLERVTGGVCAARAAATMGGCAIETEIAD